MFCTCGHEETIDTRIVKSQLNAGILSTDKLQNGSKQLDNSKTSSHYILRLPYILEVARKLPYSETEKDARRTPGEASETISFSTSVSVQEG